MEKVIAINKRETIRVVKFGDMFHLQSLISKIFGNIWTDHKTTKEEWLASKWILDKELKVSSDYPTIEEIRNKQNKENK